MGTPRCVYITTTNLAFREICLHIWNADLRVQKVAENSIRDAVYIEFDFGSKHWREVSMGMCCISENRKSWVFIMLRNQQRYGWSIIY